MKVIWTTHVEKRLIEWSKKRILTRDDIEAVVRAPEQIVSGFAESLVAQTRNAGGLLRVPFVPIEGGRVIVTLYWTSQVRRYWEEKDENSL